jgi:hypothetical protein
MTDNSIIMSDVIRETAPSVKDKVKEGVGYMLSDQRLFI